MTKWRNKDEFFCEWDPVTDYQGPDDMHRPVTLQVLVKSGLTSTFLSQQRGVRVEISLISEQIMRHEADLGLFQGQVFVRST